MARRDRVGEENRRQFKSWGTKQVREMMTAGHYEAEQRRPMAVWIAEKDAALARAKRLAIISGIVIVFIALFIILLGPASGA